MATSILTQPPAAGQFPLVYFNLPPEPPSSIPLAALADFLEDQFTKHLVDNNNHVLLVLRHQARVFGVHLSYERIAARIPGPWSVVEILKANSRASGCRRRAKAYGLRGPHFRGYDWLRLVAFHGGRCVRCGKVGPLTADHVIPLSYGPGESSNGIGNIQPLCEACHIVKEFMTLALGRPMDYRRALITWVEGA